MSTEKAASSEETLQRLWSEIALLRQEIAKAERDRAAKVAAARPSRTKWGKATVTNKSMEETMI
jgi:hypothetical protein